MPMLVVVWQIDNDEGVDTDLDNGAVKMVDKACMCVIHTNVSDTSASLKVTKSTLTSVRVKDIDQLEKQVEVLCSLFKLWRRKYLFNPPMKQLINNDGMTHYYTGLPSYAVFNIILSKLSPVVAKLGSVGSGISIGDEFLLVLTKLARSVTNQDLAYKT